MNYVTATVGALETNCYLVYCEKTMECAIVDPGAEPRRIFRFVVEKGLKPVLIVNTHGHIDHIGANRDVKEEYDIPILIHSADSPMLNNVQDSQLRMFLQAKDSPPADKFIDEGERISIGESELTVLHTPGHSEGSVSLLSDGFILSGDLLFWRSVGRTDLPGGSWKVLESSIRNRIFTLAEDVVVLPGHGPSTSVGQEKSSNPFFT
jgi:glyoxylase-like metal-dependent hydrolase (beta-lactamase superfamily II)